MLSKYLSKSILSIGCDYRNPQGGIAQVMNTYSQYVYDPFRCIVNSGGKNIFQKSWRAISAYTKTFLYLLFDQHIKIVHIHTASNISFQRSALWIKLAYYFHKKVVLHIHGGGFKIYYKSNPQWIQEILNHCDCIITLSESWYKYFTEEIHCNNVYVIENIVTPPIMQSLEKNDNRFHLLFLGLITEEKGIFDLLEMIAEHHKELSQKIVLHIGGIGKVDKLNDTIKHLQLESYVNYEGFVSGKKKQYLLNLTDALILPSYIEGLPISILEAMSYGKPILATTVGGIPEVVKHGINGFLFPPGNKAKMFEAVKYILNNEQIAKKIKHENLVCVNKHMPNEICQKLSSIYTKLYK